MNEAHHSLESLRAQGAHVHDPARFHYLEALARRLSTQPAPVQQVLSARWQAAVDAYALAALPPAEHAVEAVPARVAPTLHGTPAAAPACAAPSPLAQLNRELQTRAQAGVNSAEAADGASLSEMKSVRQFSEVWSHIAAEQQVVQALHRAPDNAGPLNSRKLMLRTLSLMRTLSPDYLRHFMSQAETLLWLDHAQSRSARTAATRGTPPAAKPGRSGRSTKR